MVKADFRMYDKYKDYMGEGFTRTEQPNTLVIHGTWASDYASLMRWMLAGSRDSEYRRGIGMYNWIIDRDGEIYNTVPEGVWTHHAHAGTALHSVMLSVCLINQEVNNQGDYTAAQYNALNKLFFLNLGPRYQLRRVMSHSASARTFAPSTVTTPCPGPRFSFDYLINEGITRGVLLSFFSPGYYRLEWNDGKEN
jgi:N-acetyl-anhydromuramyl-L-alanine amidase AmpD